MKKFGAIAALIGIGVVCFFLFKPSRPATGNLPVSTTPSTNPAKYPASSVSPTTTTTPPVSMPAPAENSPTNPSANLVAVAPGIANSPANTMEIPSLPPLTVLDNARVAIHNYHAAFGENPVGNNAEITAALIGKNPKQVNFIREDAGLRVNDRAELVDAYGTPFFFHQLSANLMEIRSAGQDRQLWTFDDIVTR
jgi:hypothetical protein